MTVSTAAAPAALRVTVWRKLKELGALYLQQSACLLPQVPATSRAVSQLSTRILRDGGTVRVLTMAFNDPTQEQEIIEELQSAREGEYAEVLERLPAFFAELEMETVRGRTTFEEVEESEADLARFRAWLEKIRGRDYFQAPLGDQARSELAKAEAAMTVFAEVAMASDHVTAGRPAEDPGSGPRLRSV